MTRIFSVPLQVNVPAGATGADSTLLLTGITQIIGAYLVFPVGTNSLLQYRFYQTAAVVTNPNQFPGGRELTGDEKNSGVYVGDGIAYPVSWQKVPEMNPVAVAMAAINNSTITLQAMAVIWMAE